jgi:hypothetical protein
MALVRCPHCGVDTTNKRASCYYCGGLLFVGAAKMPEKPSEESSKRETTPTATEPTNRRTAEHESDYTRWMKRFAGCLITFAIVFGIKDGAGISSFFIGVVGAIGIGFLYMLLGLAALAIFELIFGGTSESALPIAGCILVLTLTATILLKGTGKGSFTDCPDAGRYSEYSQCL